MPSGGKREGAGRPAKSDKKKPLAIKIDPAIADYLATVPNKTAAIEAAIKGTRDYRAFAKRRA